MQIYHEFFGTQGGSEKERDFVRWFGYYYYSARKDRGVALHESDRVFGKERIKRQRASSDLNFRKQQIRRVLEKLEKKEKKKKKIETGKKRRERASRSMRHRPASPRETRMHRKSINRR